MIESLIISIPGPLFLGIFFIFCLITIVSGRILSDRDSSSDQNIKELKLFDPIHIAALRGYNSVIQTGMFSLWNKHIIKNTGSGKNTLIESLTSKVNFENKVEEALYQWLKSPTSPYSLFNDSNLKRYINDILKPVYRELEDLYLLKNANDIFRTWIIAIAVFLLNVIFGGTKLYFGLMRDKPVGILLLLLIFAIILTFVIINPSAKTTSLGRRYLSSIEDQFGFIKDSLKKGNNPEGFSPVYGVAIFGLTALAGSYAFSSFNSLIPASGSGWIGGGGGGGCGGGGCGGGGCGGGGCGGGGCGGCGG